MSALVWTDEKPTQPGWYWWKALGLGSKMLLVFKGFQGMTALVANCGIPVGEIGGQWAGPIPEPED